MIRRNWRKWLAVVVVVIAGAAAVYWYMNRPAPAPLLEQVKLDDGNTATLVTPGTHIKARVVLSVPAEQALTDKQLTDLSKDGSAQLVQVLLAKSDCDEQENDIKAAAQHLDGPVTIFSGIGSGAAEAWSWLAKQTDDKATAVSVGFSLEQPGCATPLPKKAEHGHWIVAWNDNPDDASASFVRDTPNAETSISDYDIHLPQVLKNELTKLLVGDNKDALSMPVVEVPAGQATDTVTLFLSGDGGWRDLDRDVAGEMAKMGYPVVGIDMLRYYWQHKTPEQSAEDLSALMLHYRQKWGTKRFILAGYSFGADVLPATYNRLPADDQKRIDGVLLLAFARSGSFEIEVEGWLGNAGKEAPTGPEIAKMPQNKILCVYGVEEAEETGCTDAKTYTGETLKLPGGHHFDEDYPALAKRLIDAIEKLQGKPPVAKAN